MSDFAIYALNVGAGQVALSPIPGRSGSYEADLSRVLHWAPQMVVTMTTQPELECMGAADFGADLAAVDVDWRHVPIVDFGAPDDYTAALWEPVARDASAILAAGGRALIHCFGGCGRSGMAALRLMVDAGEDPAAALVRLRATRPCALETDAQIAWASNAV